MSTRLSFSLLVSTILVLASPAAFAQNNWIGPLYDNWSTAGNWSLNHVPTPGEDVTFGSGTAAYLDTDSSINSLVLNGYLQSPDPRQQQTPPGAFIIANALNIGPTGAFGYGCYPCGTGSINVGADLTNAGYLAFSNTNMSIVGNLSNSLDVVFNFYSTLQINGNLINSGTITVGGGPVNSNSSILKIGGTVTNLQGALLDLSSFNYFTTVGGDIKNYGTLWSNVASPLIIDGALTNYSADQVVLYSSVLAAGGVANYGSMLLQPIGGFDFNHSVGIFSTPELDNGGIINWTGGNYDIMQIGTGAPSGHGYYQLANGTLGEVIDMSSFGVITLDDATSVTLDGSLKVMLQPGYNPAVGSTYEFIIFAPGELSGVFANLQNALFNNGTEKWIVIYDNTDGYVALQATATPEPSSLLLLGSGLFGVVAAIRRRVTL